MQPLPPGARNSDYAAVGQWPLTRNHRVADISETWTRGDGGKRGPDAPALASCLESETLAFIFKHYRLVLITNALRICLRVFVVLSADIILDPDNPDA